MNNHTIFGEPPLKHQHADDEITLYMKDYSYCFQTEWVQCGHLMALYTHRSHQGSEISPLQDLNALIHTVAEHLIFY